MSSLGYCLFCKREIAPSADSCPGCGNRQFRFAISDPVEIILKEGRGCTNCSGTGNIMTRDWIKCTKCGGSGKGWGWSTCRVCSGGGSITTKEYRTRCKVCGGGGTIRASTITRWEAIDTRSGLREWSSTSMDRLDSLDADWERRLPPKERRRTGSVRAVPITCPGCKGKGEVVINTDIAYVNTQCNRCKGSKEVMQGQIEYEDIKTGKRDWINLD
jgi:DnaJ-class molecular chaperone